MSKQDEDNYRRMNQARLKDLNAREQKILEILAGIPVYDCAGVLEFAKTRIVAVAVGNAALEDDLRRQRKGEIEWGGGQ